MALPNTDFLLSDGVFAPPNDQARLSLLTDVDVGPLSLTDPSYGGSYQTWYCAYVSGEIRVRPASSSVWETLRTLAGVTEVSFTFDYRGRPVLAYVVSGAAYVSQWNGTDWADIALGAGATGPMIAQDGNGTSAGTGVTVAYLRNGYLCARQSADNYSVEYQLATHHAAATRVQRIGLSTDSRFLIELDGSVNAVTAVTQDILTDTYYCAVGDQTIPLFRGDRITGTWRSKVIQRDHYITFAWLRLDGPFESAYVRIYESGALKYSTPAITSNTPVRLPPGRYHETEIEVESDGVVTAVVLADSAQELWAA